MVVKVAIHSRHAAPPPKNYHHQTAPAGPACTPAQTPFPSGGHYIRIEAGRNRPEEGSSCVYPCSGGAAPALPEGADNEEIKSQVAVPTQCGRGIAELMENMDGLR